ncbi:MAG: hypothetical protein ABFD97_24820 [Syntrophobacter sp.]
MTEKIVIETIPITSEQIPIRRIIQPRGELALIEDGRSFRHLAYFSVNKGEGFFRGGHFHLEKVEYLYLISGRLSLKFVDIDSGESSVVEVSAGSRITIYPRCAHRFDALEEAHVIEYFDSLHDRRDDHLFPALVGQ